MLIIPEMTVPGFGLDFGVLVRVALVPSHVRATSVQTACLGGAGLGFVIVSSGKHLFLGLGVDSCAEESDKK